MTTNIALTNTKYAQAVYSSADGGGGIPFTTKVMPATQGVMDANGNYTVFTGVSWGASNPVAISKEVYNPSVTSRLIGNVALNYKILNDKVKIDYFAVSLPDLLIWEDDLNVRNKQLCQYLIGLGELGKGNTDEAKKYFELVLQGDASHKGAKSNM